VLTFVLLRFAYLPRCLCKVLLLDIFPAGGKVSGRFCSSDESDWYRSSRIANMPASVTTFRKSAPLNPSESFKSTSIGSPSPAQKLQIVKTHLDDRLEVDLAVLVDRSCMDLEDLKPRLLVRKGHLDFAVEPTGAH
jgi:hypothetical protein